eukprot:5560053-Amphidinium_carterae.2
MQDTDLGTRTLILAHPVGNLLNWNMMTQGKSRQKGGGWYESSTITTAYIHTQFAEKFPTGNGTPSHVWLYAIE